MPAYFYFYRMLRPGAAFILFLKRSALYLGLMSLCRLLFYWLNSNYFSGVGLTDFLQGIRFDALPAAFLLAPFLVVHAIPFKGFQHKMVQRLVAIYFQLVTLFSLLVNCIDMIYYRFTLKRTTYDIFDFVSTGDDTASLIPQFLLDYWYIALIFIGLGTLSIWMYGRINASTNSVPLKNQIVFGIITVIIVMIAGRGGVQLKPLHIIDASRYTLRANVPLILSTPFTLLKTINSEPLSPVVFFEYENKLTAAFNADFKLEADSQQKKKNIVVIIMESMSREYIGYFNEGQGYTPFLDSLISRSIVFDHAFANGRRSIEALPAIFSGFPNLMNEAYITSPYSGNKITSMAAQLKKFGYRSVFFHGGKNGTMGFNSYTRSAGFDKYYGLNEYPGKDDFDGNWGIYDGPYLKYVADVQDSLSKPFMSGIFTLSAHHPYSLPEGTEIKCKKKKLPIHPTICYADQALKEYFEKVSRKSWYAETIFLLTADHTAQSINPAYSNSMGIYAIPIILFDPEHQQGKLISKTTQQSDITPTLFDYLGLPLHMVCFGQSGLDTSVSGFAVNYLQDVYQIISDDQIILFDGNRVIGGGDHLNDPLLTKNLYKKEPGKFEDLEGKLKSLIQQYNQRMIDNQLLINE